MQTTLKVTGMMCGHCERHVTRALKSVSGVESVSASHAQNHAVVTHSADASVAAMIDAVVECGYETSEEEGGDDDDPDPSSGDPDPSSDDPDPLPGDPDPLPDDPDPSSDDPDPLPDDPDPLPGDPDPSSDDPDPSSDDLLCELNLRVGGMHCASCVGRVESTLSTIKGVEFTSVQLLQERATVRYHPDETDPTALLEALEGVGYPSQVASRDERSVGGASAPLEVLQNLPLKIGVSLGIGVIAMIASMPLMTHGEGLVGGWMGPVNAGLEAVFPWLYRASHDALRWGLLLSSLPVVGWAGRHFFVRAWRLARRGGADMNTLIALGAGTAFVSSAAVTIAPSAAVAVGLPLHVWFEAIPWVIGLVMLGNHFEAKAKGRTKEALEALASLQPSTARVVTAEGVEEERALVDVHPGDLVRVRPGEAIPVDGVIERGSTTVDESMLTGESRALPRGPGEEVFTATVNGEGALTVRARGLGADTALARIIRMVEDAQTARPEIQRLADRIASVFVPVIVVIALLSGGLWLALGPAPELGYALRAVMTVLIIACPCAMGLAVPTAVMVATGRAARFGILIRSGEMLEQGHRVDTVVFDKTGTLTQGAPQVEQLNAHSPALDRGAVLAWTAAIEAQSEHPLAVAIVDHARAEGHELLEARDVRAHTGRGVEGRVDGHHLLVGTSRFLIEQGIEVEEAPLEATLTPVLVAVDGVHAATLGLSDALKPEARAAIARLRAMGLRVSMLSGDRRAVAEHIGARLGLDEVRAEARPEDKHAYIEALREAGAVVAMVGDGVNDAPALAAADLGIAMGTGTDVAAAASDVTLMRGDLHGVADALELSRESLVIIKQNLFWAFGYNVLGVPIAAGALFPIWGVLLSPAFASGAMAFSSVSVVLNALRLQRWSVAQR